MKVCGRDVALVLCLRCHSRSALSPDVKSVSILWETKGVIGNVSWQQHFSLTLWELAQGQTGTDGIRREGGAGGPQEEDLMKMVEWEGKWSCWWEGKHARTATLGPNKDVIDSRVCVQYLCRHVLCARMFVCVPKGEPIHSHCNCVRMNNVLLCVCQCMHAFHVRGWQKCATQSQRDLDAWC